MQFVCYNYMTNSFYGSPLQHHDDYVYAYTFDLHTDAVEALRRDPRTSVTDYIIVVFDECKRWEHDSVINSRKPLA